MLKVKPSDGYPPEKGRYVRGNDYSPAAVCTILDTFDFAIPKELNELVMAGADTGAAISGMLQTENIGIEKIICNIVANPNIRYLILCGRESSGHLPGEALLMLKQNGVSENMRILGSNALTPNLSNIPLQLITRFREQVVIINLLCKGGETDMHMPGLDTAVIKKAIWSCYQESPVEFMGYSLYDVGAFSEPPIFYQIIQKLDSNQEKQAVEPGKSKMGLGLSLHKYLPKTDCTQCGKKNCLAFAIGLAKRKSKIDECPILQQPELFENRNALMKLIE